MAPTTDELMAVSLSVGGRRRRFGELTVADVETHAATLRQAAGLGHGNRVGAVAARWAQLSRTMASEGASTVADLDPATVAELAEQLWIVPPGGSLLP